MTHQTPSTASRTSPEVVTRWLRSDPDPDGRRCVCCPEQPSHVFAYSAELVDPDDTQWQSRDLSTREPTGHFDYVRFFYDAIRQMPEGTRLRIVIEPVNDSGEDGTG